MLQKAIENKIKEYIDPYLKTDYLTAHVLKSLTVDQNQIELNLTFGYPCGGIESKIKEDLIALLNSAYPDKAIRINLTTKIDAHVGQQGIPGLPNVKNIIAVASGKGGVGKSTVAINLALALAKEGATVGILDADIYGPSQPSMLGTKGQRPVFKDGLLPIMQHGLQSMSIGYLVDQTAPMVWRGPMLGKALQQLLNDTKWQALDYMIVDLPPGTGDVQLTLCQKIPVSGAVIVTTPQDLALVDVARACEMFNKLNVPILGVVENMSIYHCPKCGHKERIFGEGGALKLAAQFQLAFLGNIPLDIQIREMTDSGNPPVVQAPESAYAGIFIEIARLAAAKLALQRKDYSAKFGKIVVS